MSLVAPVKDGKIQDVTQLTSSAETSSSNSTLDKQAFLQLLVAQMKYQDPLEPTSNTEYISQLATFSELEEMQNMRGSIDLQRASQLVGQEVYMKTTDATTGNTNYVHGKVDYVIYENGKAYLSIDGKNYPLDDLDSIYDTDYTDAYTLAYNWTVGLNKLPALDKLTLDYKDTIYELKDTFDKMTDYQKTFITAENQEKIQNYYDKITLMYKLNEALSGKEDDKDTDASDKDTSGTTDDTVSGSGSTTDKADTDSSTSGSGSTDSTDTDNSVSGSESTDSEAAEDVVSGSGNAGQTDGSAAAEESQGGAESDESAE